MPNPDPNPNPNPSPNPNPARGRASHYLPTSRSASHSVTATSPPHPRDHLPTPTPRPPPHPNPETALAEEPRHRAPSARQVRATLIADQLDLLADWGGGTPAAAHALLERLHVCSRRAWEAHGEAEGAPKEEL